MSEKFTQEQQAALDADGRVIVSASAGSGKTTVMIEKIIRLICNDELSVDGLLAVTFTKKAAAQMKEKLAEALISALNSDGVDERRRKALKEQLAEVPNADISTIHSFCAKLIRTHFFAANVENTFRVIGGDDAEGVALKNEALDELLDEGYESKDGQFAQLLALYWRKKSDNTLRKIITETYEKLRNRADYREYLAAIKGYDARKFDDVCADLYTLFMQKCRYYLDGLETERIFFGNGQSAQQKLLDELTAWVEEMLAAPDYFALAKVEKPKFTANRKTKSMSAECLLHVERLSFLKDRLTKAFESEFEKMLSREEELDAFIRSGETAEALAVYLLKFDEKYEMLKKERGVLDYNDLEHKALALLKDETVAAEVREKYSRVFVDEYQDVNPVQEEIISRLSGDNLFLVGDVKQSIYGFRGSKSRFFVEKQRAFERGDGQSLKMTRNFRSSDKVLDAVNAQFSLAMTPQVCDVDYARDSFMERGGLYPLGDGRVQVHFFGKEEKETAARGVYSVRDRAEKNTVEPTNVAKMVRQIIDDERRLKIYDVKRKAYRPVEYSDIAILSRKKRGQIAKTVAALAAEDIPVTTATAVNICEYAEVKTLMDILSLIDNAEQDVPLCSALLSAMGGLTADELTEIRLAYKNEPFFRKACLQYAAEKTDRIAGKLKKFYAYFESVRTRAHILSAGEILTLLIGETGMERDLLSHENGTACMRRVHRFIEETSTEESLSVHDFLDRLRDLDYEIEFCEGGGDDSVKVLTMHSSKGLEYPVVILDNLSADFRGGDHEEVYVEEKYGLAPRAFDERKMLKTTTRLRRLHELKEMESSVLDELNLYYVALTRAKYALHMLFEKPTSMSDVKYARSFAEFTDFSVWKEYFAADEIFDVPKLERQALEYHPDPALVRSIMDAYQWRYAYAGCENLPVKSSATQLIAGGAEKGAFAEGQGIGFGKVVVSDEEFERVDDTEDDGIGADIFGIDVLSAHSSRDKAKAEGVAYHAFLERFNFGLLWDERGEPIAKECLTRLIEECLSAFAKEDERACALLDKAQLTEILSNPVFYELQGMRLYKEQQFLVTLPIKDTYAKRLGAESDLSETVDSEEMIFQGAIDLLALNETNGRVRIVDYKYSAHDGEYLRERYRLQLELYRLATAKILKIEPSKIECAIVNIRRGFQVDMD